MSKNIKIENFKIFMAIHGIEERVIELINQQGFTTDYYLKAVSPLRYFDSLGIWQQFEEGRDFWKDVHDKWESILDSGVVLEKPFPNLKSIW